MSPSVGYGKKSGYAYLRMKWLVGGFTAEFGTESRHCLRV